MGSRRNFLKNTTAAGIGLSFWPELLFSRNEKSAQLKVAMIGVGLRGTNHLENLLLRKDVLITAICDIDPVRIDLCLDLISKAAMERPQVFGKNELDYKNLLDLKDVDAVIISTPWIWHAKMATDAMLAGKYTGLEVSAASTLDECWGLVNTHEKTGTHLMILENVNYRRDIMAVLNMVRQDVFGELVHFRCGYQHDLRFVKFNDGKTAYGRGAEFGEKGNSEAKWRTLHSITQNADVYPTHGLGPVAVMNNINRGNRFLSLTSMLPKAGGFTIISLRWEAKITPTRKLILN
ncbi:MAG: Gfo/Idh/MocA family oxidoreductase [Flavobacteriaceae bacterium]|nr:Gfo/Idh/MocA family oxidoreductase [Flavobacteriaceae bacterium]